MIVFGSLCRALRSPRWHRALSSSHLHRREMVRAPWRDRRGRAEGETSAFCEWNQAGTSRHRDNGGLLRNTHFRSSNMLYIYIKICNTFKVLKVVFLSQEKELGSDTWRSMNPEECRQNDFTFSCKHPICFNHYFIPSQSDQAFIYWKDKGPTATIDLYINNHFVSYMELKETVSLPLEHFFFPSDACGFKICVTVF